MASFFKKLQNKYVFSSRNQDNFFESSKLSLSGYELLSILLLLLTVLLFIAYLMFKFTPLQSFFITDQSKKKIIIELNQKTDSLEQRSLIQDQYITSIKRILNGEQIDEAFEKEIDSTELTLLSISDPTSEEIKLRNVVNSREQLQVGSEAVTSTLRFLAPIEGVISSNYLAEESHFGIDIVAPKNTPIKAIADGVVIYSSWNIADGYTMVIYHENNFVSIYKHTEKLLKEINESISIGEAIAIIGNSGENTTGYHLHFELWQNGVPLDPTTVINFEP